MKYRLSFLLSFSLCFLGHAESNIPTIRLPNLETKADSEDRISICNQKLKKAKSELSKLFNDAQLLLDKGASDAQYLEILQKIQQTKKEMEQLQGNWREASVEESRAGEEGYGIWDLGETTLSNLVMEYGSSEFVYIIPQNLGSIKIQLYSALSIPKESWSEMVDLILVQNGIGVKVINPFVKQLYMMKQNMGMVEAIVQKSQDLERFSEGARVAYVFSPKPEDIKAVQGFFERFSDINTTAIYPVASKLVLVSYVENIRMLLNLYESVWLSESDKTVKIVPLTKLDVKEADEIVQAFFKPKNIKVRPSFYQQTAEEIVTMVLPQGLVLIGDQSLVKRAEEVLKDIEKQLDEPSQMTTYWYTCKHSDPKELAAVLERVYESLTQVAVSTERKMNRTDHKRPDTSIPPVPTELKTLKNENVLPIQPKFVEPGTINREQNTVTRENHANFIVDPKTTSILMVIRKDLLPEMKRVVRKMDVAKKMVHIEVLLVEKKIHDRNEIGINLLKIGSPASDKKLGGMQYDTNVKAVDKGILSFLLSRPKTSAPAFDIVYNFLMAQNDIRINANPSVIAVNQTPATISIMEELSINNGAVLVEGGASGVAAEKSFTRAQYGINIVMTPTIHMPTEIDEDPCGYVTLNTNVTFDTTQSSRDDRPPVTRRHVENEVRIADGETIILGGLKRQSSENDQEKIPFLGDIPGIGKLFGTTKQSESTTEMFIFITPRIIKDDREDQIRLRQKELQRRPGDIPAFLEKMKEARENEEKQLFEQSIKMLFQ